MRTRVGVPVYLDDEIISPKAPLNASAIRRLQHMNPAEVAHHDLEDNPAGNDEGFYQPQMQAPTRANARSTCFRVSKKNGSSCSGGYKADVEPEVAAQGVPKKRTFKKFSFRGVDLDALLDMSTDELVKLFSARARRRFQRGLTRKPMALIKKLRKAKREAPAGEKPEPVRTHLRNMIIVPEMIGSIIGVYNGKTFNQVEIKPEMIGHYLAEFSISYKPVKHGRPGIGATHSSRFIPLK
ncbi:40S ribosomal protein S15-4 [Lathyrus oleraceus]|uniref:40S ribosomal protein S15-4 n=2 Tax=Pentapetalae TaxID=1437201 RepID=A0A9D4W5F4_PEA|nr:40S ribosomal protein S15-4 [Pisum sativum]